MKWLAMIVLLAILLAPCGAVKFTSGSDTNNNDNPDNNDVQWQGNPDDNTFSASEVETFGEHLVNGTLPNIPDGKPIKVILFHEGSGDEMTWEQILTNFQTTDNFFENDADKTAFEQENQDFKDGKPTAFPIHMKQCQRLLQYAAGEVSLSSDARMENLIGTIRIDNEGRQYNLPVVGLISRSKTDMGLIVYPDTEKDGINDNDRDLNGQNLKTPFTPGEFDQLTWFETVTT